MTQDQPRAGEAELREAVSKAIRILGNNDLHETTRVLDARDALIIALSASTAQAEVESTDCAPMISKLQRLIRNVQRKRTLSRTGNHAGIQPMTEAVNMLPEVLSLLKTMEFERDCAFEQRDDARQALSAHPRGDAGA